ncbi:hypothetical protein FQ085_15995 [Planococcus sp. ANT_H30]|nr:hypothetical protein FQ085_15995 [Planococcus sp. ANT_H30]
MMKKFVSMSLMLVLLTGVASPAFATSDKDYEEAIRMIEKTNLEIDKKIEKAVTEADELQAEYLLDIREIEEGGKIFDIQKEKNKILSEMEESKNDVNKQQKYEEKLLKLEAKLGEEQAKIEKEMKEISAEIEELTKIMILTEEKDSSKLNKQVNKLNEKLNKKSIKHAEITAEYTEDLNEVITKIYDVTLKMSAETIAKAASKGVEAECSWKLVRFADQWVWIDPIRVVGRR